MPAITYIEKKFGKPALRMIALVDKICRDYKAQGYDLTLRQLYYQFVARDLFPPERKFSWTGAKWVRDVNGTINADPNYKWLGSLVNDARLAGYIDWDFIVDRTRNLQGVAHFEKPEDIIEQAAKQFRHAKWADQDYHVEVWVEKDALVGVLESCCPKLDVDFFSCRGYTSQSEMWSAAQRLGGAIDNGKKVRIIHLGDHDPSGIDMSRDVEDRLATFIAQDLRIIDPFDPSDGYYEDIVQYAETCRVELGTQFEVDRVALNMDQIKMYNPPPNPAKLTDARARTYVAKHGRLSWELDALDPSQLVSLITEGVEGYRDDERWDEAVAREREERKLLALVSKKWIDIKTMLEDDSDDED